MRAAWILHGWVSKVIKNHAISVALLMHNMKTVIYLTYYDDNYKTHEYNLRLCDTSYLISTKSAILLFHQRLQGWNYASLRFHWHTFEIDIFPLTKQSVDINQYEMRSTSPFCSCGAWNHTIKRTQRNNNTEEKEKKKITSCLWPCMPHITEVT